MHSLEDCVFVFDFDGVIYDPIEDKPRPVGIEALRTAASVGWAYIVTGRPEREVSFIRAVLAEAGLRAPILARPRNLRGNEVLVKVELWSRLLEEEECILEVHDDKEVVLHAARRYARGALVLHQGGQCWSIRGRSLIPVCNL